MSAMSITGPTAASAAVSAASTSSPVRARAPRRHHRLELVAVLGAAGERREPLVVADAEQRRAPAPATESLLVDTAIHRPSRAAVRARGARCTAARRRAAAAARRCSAYSDGSGPISWNIVSSRLTSTTWPTPAVQGDHRGERRGEPGDLVGEGDRRQQRLAVGLAVDRGEPGHRLGDRGEPRPLGVRAVLAEAGDPRDDEARVAGEQHVGPEPEPLERAGPEVLDEHVGVVDEAQQRRRRSAASLRSSDDRALVAVGQLPPQALAVALVAPRHVAQAVAAGPLDLDHVGAEVGEVAGAVRAGEHGRQVEDAQVGERQPASRHGPSVDDRRQARRRGAGRRRGRRGRRARRACRARRCGRRRARRCGRRRGSSTAGGR